MHEDLDRSVAPSHRIARQAGLAMHLHHSVDQIDDPEIRKPGTRIDPGLDLAIGPQRGIRDLYHERGRRRVGCEVVEGTPRGSRTTSSPSISSRRSPVNMPSSTSRSYSTRRRPRVFAEGSIAEVTNATVAKRAAPVNVHVL